MSGCTPKCSQAHSLPVRPSPHCTSSKTSRAPASSHRSLRPCRKSLWAVLIPPSPCRGSTKTAQVSPCRGAQSHCERPSVWVQNHVTGCWLFRCRALELCQGYCWSCFDQIMPRALILCQDCSVPKTGFSAAHMKKTSKSCSKKEAMHICTCCIASGMMTPTAHSIMLKRNSKSAAASYLLDDLSSRF